MRLRRIEKSADQWDHTNAMGHSMAMMIELPLLLLLMFVVLDGWWPLLLIPVYGIFFAVRLWWDSTEWEKDSETQHD